MPKTPDGFYSNSMVQSVKLAEALQGKSVAYIKESFAVVKDEGLKLETLTWEKFMEKLTDAEDNDEIDKLNEQLLGQILAPIIQQVLTADQEEGGAE